MALKSKLFRANQRLQECLIKNGAHVTTGSRGVHVALIQYAVLRLASGEIDGAEINGQIYGRTTAAVVLAYKTERKIINTAYQTAPDGIVGKMTIAALDREMVLSESRESAPNNRP
jgi:DNA-binding NarL/FixJ family response regulator